MRRLVRLTWRLQRFELGAVVVGSIALSILGLVLARSLTALAGPACETGLVSCVTGDEFRLVDAALAGPFMAVMAVVPFAAGAILGAPIVGAELERGTAPVTWSLAPSRRRWLIGRVVPVGIVLVGSMIAVALVADRLEAARNPLLNPATSFVDYGLRGPLVAGKALAAFAVAVLAGALTGRVLPALIVTAAVSLLLVNVLGAAMTRWLPVGEVEGFQSITTAIGYRETIATADGAYLGVADAVRRARTGPPPGHIGSAEWQPWMEANGYRLVSVAITGERMPEIELRELAVLVGVAAGSVAATAAAVARRRPG